MNATDTPLTIKGYFDGSFKEDAKIGIGGWYFVITGDSKFMTLSNFTYEAAEDSVISEFIGLIGLLSDINKYTKGLPIKSISICGDCKAVLDRINQKIKYKKKYIPYIDKVKQLINTINIPIIFIKIKRKKNKKADGLCRVILKNINSVKLTNNFCKKSYQSIQPIHLVSPKTKVITPLTKLRKVNNSNLRFRQTPKYDRIVELLNQISGQ